MLMIINGTNMAKLFSIDCVSVIAVRCLNINKKVAL